ncbi:IPT/TIG domain-containing protein [Chloroflexota bacterium]
MKVSKILRILAMTVLLAVMALPVAGVPALAAEDITLDPDEGDIEVDRIDITGDGFDAGDDVFLYFSPEDVDEGDDVEDLDYYEEVKETEAGLEGDSDEGEIDTWFRVPDLLTDGPDDHEVIGGEYYVYATEVEEGEILAKDQFTVVAGSIKSINPDSGVVGTEVEISGEYYDGSDDIIVYYDDEEIDIADGDDDTDSSGEFDTVIIIPDSTAGDHTIAVRDEAEDADGEPLHIAEVEFVVEPEMTIGASSGKVDDSITISGTGFKGDKDITVELGSSAAVISPSGADTDAYGSFNVAFIVPDVDAATYQMDVSDGTNTESVNFTVLVSLNMSISPTTGDVGTTITVNGAGFIPGIAATVKYDDEVMGTVPVASDKSVLATFDAPASSGGSHTVIVTDGTNTLTATFTMESTAPTIPPPLKPEMGIKAERPVYFDWEDITDASLPVTYTLQIATDEEFAAASIVLEKKALTKSEYTITEVEKLEPIQNDAPYYWRVKATDGAANDSGWSGAGTFLVGGLNFSMPGWLIYTLCGVGALLLGIVGYWLGRRTAYSYY